MGDEGYITSIKVNRKHANIYSITIEGLDEPLEVHEDIFISFGLSKGKSLTSSLIDEIREENANYLAYIKGIRYLGPKARSNQQLAQYLRRQQFAEHNISNALARLSAEGYMNDRQFANQYVSSQLGKQGKGRLRIAQELKGKGISSTIIEQTMANVDEEAELEGAYKAAQKKLRSLKGEEIEIRRKLLQFLMRCGYSRAISREVMKMLENEAKKDAEEV